MTQQPDNTGNAPERVRFGPGETDTMPKDMAEYVMRRLYARNRKVFARFMMDFHLDAPGGPGAK